MHVLLDSHILVWAVANDRRLPRKARSVILDPDNIIYYSSVSLWELSIKRTLHPDNVTFTSEVLDELSAAAGYVPMTLKATHVFSLSSLTRSENAPEHKDPFDRMLIAQAKAEDMVFLTHDKLLPFYEEPCIMLV